MYVAMSPKVTAARRGPAATHESPGSLPWFDGVESDSSGLRELRNDLGGQPLHLLCVVDERIQQDYPRSGLDYLPEPVYAGYGRPGNRYVLESAPAVVPGERGRDSFTSQSLVVFDVDTDPLCDPESGWIASLLGQLTLDRLNLLGECRCCLR